MLDFEKNMFLFNTQKIQVIAASVDAIEQAQETVDRYHISFKVGYGLDAREVSSRTGAFFDEKESYLNATGFVINPEGVVTNAVYSTLAIGRVTPADCLSIIHYFAK